MAVASNFLTTVDPIDEFTKSRILVRPPHCGTPILLHGNEKIYFHTITKVQLTVTTDAATTDTNIIEHDYSTLKVVSNAVFNTTLKNMGLDELVAIGLVIGADLESLSDDTDDGDYESNLGVGYQEGNAPTSLAADSINLVFYKFLNEKIVEAAAQHTVPYSEPIVHYFSQPIVMRKGETKEHYFPIVSTVARITGKESRARLAQTVAEVATIGVKTSLILVSKEFAGQYPSMPSLRRALGLTRGDQ